MINQTTETTYIKTIGEKYGHFWFGTNQLKFNKSNQSF